MTALVRAEWLKQRTTFTTIRLLAAMAGLIALVILLHAAGMSADKAATRANQFQIFHWAPLLSGLFAALVGATAITGEIRYGTIRPSFLITPRRDRVFTAKVSVAAVTGLVFGLVGSGLVVALTSIVFAARGIPIRLDGGDIAQLIGGTAVGAALFSAFGVGIGALVRDQVPAVVGLFAWLFLVENLLLDAKASIGQFSPGAAATAFSGLRNGPDKLLNPVAGLFVLAAWAVVALAWGRAAILRRDVS